MRTCVIGDIHGCSAALDELLARLAPRPGEDRLVFLGDYVDRGPDSRGVVAAILELAAAGVQVVPLMGNHEEVLLEFLAGRETAFYHAIGGSDTLLSYGGAVDDDGAALALRLPEAHLRFFHSLLPCWEDEYGIYVHAGLKPGLHLSMQPADWLYWGAGRRFLDRCAKVDYGKTVVFGHSVHPEPLVEPYRIGIDTGAVYGGHLTCLILPEKTFLHVPSRRYWPHKPKDAPDRAAITP